MLKFYNQFPRFYRSRNLIFTRQITYLNNPTSFRYHAIKIKPNYYFTSNKKFLFSTSASLSNSNTIDSSPPSTLLPETLPTDDVNFIISFNQSVLEFMHNSTALPWWATILISTILLRTLLTLPIAIIQQKSGARMISLQPQIMDVFEKLKHEVVREVKKRNGTYEEFQRELTKRFRAKINEIYKANKCSPIRNYLLPWVQIPLFISNSLTLRHMVDSAAESSLDPITGSNVLDNSTITLDSLINGGTLWFNDLTLSDPTFIFPLAIGLTNFFNIEVHSWSLKSQPSLRSKILKNLSRVLSVLMIPVASQAPMAICLYWLSSSTFSIGQNLIFQFPFIQKKFGFSEKKIDISSLSKQTEKEKESFESIRKNNDSNKKNAYLKKKKKK
ncbi:14150_t:CDS:2 [Funneliformis caledonium]|uniref:14150_t:CDS:1 n=2 Tax=Funneliformis TaxID=1117308 RepID=A0A9N8YY15_9GLOM|nr:14150_t:CDS:2 [Funneliformis caledonium]CAG8461814.1 7597_t:CDS:2 [Funneliformis mosseae]